MLCGNNRIFAQRSVTLGTNSVTSFGAFFVVFDIMFCCPTFTAMADDKLPNIDKLNSGNWPIWKMQISNYLVARRM